MDLSFGALAPEYARLWQSMTIVPSEVAEFQAIAKRLLANLPRYLTVEASTGVPASVIAVIHEREADSNFRCHLHNGDPLSARTVHVPTGRPPLPATPPFTWEQSAIDALTYEGLAGHPKEWWTVERIAWVLEKYNGFGYRQYHNEHSPYLWAGTNIQEPGKYEADGQFNRSAVDTQLGALPLLKMIWDLDVSLKPPMEGAIPRPAPAPVPPIPQPRPTPTPAPAPAPAPLPPLLPLPPVPGPILVTLAPPTPWDRIKDFFRGILRRS